jgi:DoxX-like family
MNITTGPPAIARRSRSTRWRMAGYWLATMAVAAELAVGGIWDIMRLPSVRDLVMHLGYPSYFLVLLGSWKVLGAAALLIPRRPLLKEWAYAGAFFTYTGAIASHLATGYDLTEAVPLAILTALTALSWALRPPSRRMPRRTSTAPPAVAADGTPGAAYPAPVTGYRAAGASEAAAGAATPRTER